MKPNLPYKTFGFRFGEKLQQSGLYQLFALGCDRVTYPSYDWDGLKRIDGPLYLFQYTLSGSGKLELDNETFQIGPGSGFLVDIPSRHRYYLPAESPAWEFIFILFRPSHLEMHWKDAVRQLGRIPLLPADSSPIRLLQDMIAAAHAGRINDGYTASSYVYQFMMELLRAANGKGLELKAWPSAVQLVAEAIRSNYANWHSLDDMTEVAGLSKYHLVRTFKRHTGLSPIEYLTKVRMERSVELLRNTSMSLEEIARELGYSGSSYFIKVFRKWVGFTPGEYRAGQGLLAAQDLKFD